MKRKLIGIAFVMLVFVAGCSGQSTTEKMYNHLEEAVSLESEFVNQQEPLSKLEQEEQKIFQEISKLNMDQFDQITSLADEALASIEKRRELLKKEKESIEAAKKEFDQINPLVDKLKEASLKDQASQMQQAMEDRYNAYIALHDAYQTSLDYDQKIYELLKQEELEESTLFDQIEKVNNQYEKVTEANTIFSENTDAFNEQKQAFYEATDLDITYEN
ncbi:hypothetical protein Pryu01_03078 [Paraliobacillus ryukyuensis]|uniref:Putative cell-wall binding lipoprotein n=1 Tax=Paraliobacillus ryukyuensis TaxID=200904 RepID=A0A366DS46_9BACI|nr:YkyA family protein [Paraliobacillus ryukyuensis]RBO92028.1 putative cell-wall binding lipoprotein [Paraliobacillus ryukyuensis]